MPKFLDAPSWYDETGTLRTLSGTVRFNSLAGFVDLPYTTFASGGARSSYYVLTSAGTNGNIAYSNGSYPMWLSNGTSGQVLTSNGNAAPSWKNPSLYTHLIMIGTSATSGASPMSGTAVFSVNNFSSEEYTREEIISFLETVKTQFEGGGANSHLDGLPCFFTPNTNYSGETLAPAGYVWAKNGVVYISGITVMTNPVGSGPVFGERTGSLIANASYLQVFKDWVISAP